MRRLGWRDPILFYTLQDELIKRALFSYFRLVLVGRLITPRGEISSKKHGGTLRTF